jgi:hypothetical protein
MHVAYRYSAQRGSKGNWRDAVTLSIAIAKDDMQDGSRPFMTLNIYIYISFRSDFLDVGLNGPPRLVLFCTRMHMRKVFRWVFLQGWVESGSFALSTLCVVCVCVSKKK